MIQQDVHYFYFYIGKGKRRGDSKGRETRREETDWGTENVLGGGLGEELASEIFQLAQERL